MIQSTCTEIASKLRELGWLWEIKPEEVRKLTPDTGCFCDAMRKYQAFMSESFAQLCKRCDPGHAVEFGEIDHPANLELVRLKRCPMPDKPPF